MKTKLYIKNNFDISEGILRIYKKAAFPVRMINQKRYKNSFLLNTMRKSGSHYFMSIIANYIALQYVKHSERLGFLEMKGTRPVSIS